MTSGEMKFALVVESVLNSVPEPEYRQMLVEAICVVSMIVENQVCGYIFWKGYKQIWEYAKL